MKLKSLKLTNFKGIKGFSMEPDGKDVSVYGENCTGKTTLADSIAWLLYDQDSTGASLLPKPLDITGEAAHGIYSDVEAVFMINDTDIMLKKSFTEKWTKRHGAANKIFTGHTTNYYIDDVPVKEKDYKKWLEAIAPDLVFKLLTSTRYFSEGLHWQERRSILLDICGDISDEDIIAGNKSLSRIPEILDGKTFDERKKIVVSQKTKLNSELNELPVRLDEVEKGLPDITSLNKKVIEKELEDLSKALTEKNEEAARIEAGGEIAEKVKKQREIEGKLLEIENETSGKRHQAEEEQRKKTSDLEVALRDERTAYEKTCEAINQREEINAKANAILRKLRSEWNTVNDQVFNEIDTVCPTCTQNYPESMAQEIRDRFHTDKAEKLDSINQGGKTIKADIEERNKQNKFDQVEADNYQKKIEELTEQIDELKAQAPGPVKETKKQEALAADLTELKLTINGLRANSREAIGNVQTEIFAISEKRTERESKKQTLASYVRGQKRIAELSDQQKTYAAEFERLEADLFIMDEFTRAKVAMLENKVNDKFKMAKFKLFNILVNGGLEECCETIYQGIPWSSGLNNSSQINVGIDIINTLSEHFDLTLPVFIDNAESITKLIPSDSQIIRLVVDEKYKELTVK